MQPDRVPIPNKSSVQEDADQQASLPVQDPELRDMPQPLEQDEEGAEGEPAGGPELRSDIGAYGFVPFHRAYQSKWWWQHKPWSYAQLFLWMLMNANYKSRQTEYEGKIIQIPRGAFATSKLALHDRAGMARGTVDLFIRKMVEAGELRVLQSGHTGVVITLCHYEEYTGIPQRARQRTRPRTEQTTGT